MAFGWLDAAELAIGAGGVAASFFGGEKNQAAGPAILPSMIEASNRSGQIAKALTKSDLGEYGYLADDLQAEARRSDAGALKDLMRLDKQSRVNSASGLGVFQGDRRDETLAREWIRARETSQQKARDTARAYLTQALNANNVAMGGFGQVAGQQNAINAAEDARFNRQLETGYAASGGLIDTLRRTQAPTVGLNINQYPTTTGTLAHYPSFVQES